MPQLAGALTVLQPFAWAIVTGRKDVENRGWRFPFGTPAWIAVHAGRKAVAVPIPERWVGTVPNVDGLPRSAFVGVVQITAQHEAADCGGECSPWGAPEGWHWSLNGGQPFELPVPAYGQLRIWQPGPALSALLEEAARTEEKEWR